MSSLMICIPRHKVDTSCPIRLAPIRIPPVVYPDNPKSYLVPVDEPVFIIWTIASLGNCFVLVFQ